MCMVLILKGSNITCCAHVKGIFTTLKNSGLKKYSLSYDV